MCQYADVAINELLLKDENHIRQYCCIPLAHWSIDNWYIEN